MSNSLILISICLSKFQLKVVTVRSATRDQVGNFNMSKNLIIDPFKDPPETSAVSISLWDYFH